MIRRVYLSKVLAVLLSVTLLIGVSGALQTGSAAASWAQVGNTLANGSITSVNLVNANGVAYTSYVLKGKTYVKKLAGTKWVSVGGAISGAYSNLMVSNNVPYVSSQYTVYRFVGGKWQKLGTSGLPTGSYWDAWKMAVYNGVPYIAYGIDTQTDNCVAAIYVKKYVGSKWVAVGGSVGQYDLGQFSDSLSLIVSGGTPYLASCYCNVVKMYNGSTWVPVGSPDVSGEVKLAMGSSALFAVVTAGMEKPNTFTVQKYANGKWSQAGGTIRKSTSDFGLAVSGQSAYLHYTYLSKLYVKKLNGNTWAIVGAGLPLKSGYGKASLALVSGVPYVAYVDTSNNLIVNKYR